VSTCRLGVVVAVVLASALAGCTPAPASTSVPSPTPSATPQVLDLTQPGVAAQVVTDILAAAGTNRALKGEVTRAEASVDVLREGVAQTWAYRGGTIAPVQSDVDYVSQASFDVADFNLADVGALFRAARAVSGSDASQALQIVDYSAGLLAMTVSTNPESRTVFFQPDGSLLPTLDFTGAWGLELGYRDVVGGRGEAQALGFGSTTGVYLDAPGPDGTMVRRTRAARTPVIVTTRAEQPSGATFDPALVRPAVVWGVLTRLHAEGTFTLTQDWSCVADDRAGDGTPRLYFQVGQRAFSTDLTGQVLEG